MRSRGVGDADAAAQRGADDAGRVLAGCGRGHAAFGDEREHVALDDAAGRTGALRLAQIGAGALGQMLRAR